MTQAYASETSNVGSIVDAAGAAPETAIQGSGSSFWQKAQNWWNVKKEQAKEWFSQSQAEVAQITNDTVEALKKRGTELSDALHEQAAKVQAKMDTYLAQAKDKVEATKEEIASAWRSGVTIPGRLNALSAELNIKYEQVSRYKQAIDVLSAFVVAFKSDLVQSARTAQEGVDKILNLFGSTGEDLRNAVDRLRAGGINEATSIITSKANQFTTIADNMKKYIAAVNILIIPMRYTNQNTYSTLQNLINVLQNVETYARSVADRLNNIASNIRSTSVQI